MDAEIDDEMDAEGSTSWDLHITRTFNAPLELVWRMWDRSRDANTPVHHTPALHLH